jgi:hypothetical protein
MIFPFESLSGTQREFGLVMGVLIGFCFGFVLERAGFGRSTKLAAQFYLHDMTVFKVMFSAIVTAMLGVVVADGLGWVDLLNLGQWVVSGTFIWPMLVGGLLLGAGFIISGYCPGTSLVAAASGALDGLLAFVGVVLGSVLFGVVYPAISGFYLCGDQGQVFIYQWLDIPPAFVALAVTAMAIGCFLGAEKVEKYVTETFFRKPYEAAAQPPRRFAFASFALVSALGLVLFLVPVGTRATEADTVTKTGLPVDVEGLARRILDEPWNVRIIDLRPEQAFLDKRIPGSENATVENLPEMGLQYSSGIQDLVLVAEGDLVSLPAAALEYPGQVFWLKNGFGAWKQFALDDPEPPAASANEQQIANYRFQSAVHSAVTGGAAPPPPKPTKFKAPPKRKAGGCS